MITVTEAQKSIRQHAVAIAPEAVLLAHAHGRVLREPVAAAEDMPAFDRSAMDGYAVGANDPADEFEVVGEIRAGDSVDLQLKSGTAMRIFTGARLPGPGLKVVMQEHVEAKGARMRITKRMAAGHVRFRGEDARAGEILLQPGMVLDATALALLASIGKTSVLVSRQPRILHLTTGDEVIPPDQTPKEGQIRNSNASLIAGLCREAGVEAIHHVHGNDDLPTLLRLLAKAKAKTFDLVLISGGSGQGSYDFSGEIFKKLGATILFREVNVRPGKPLIFGTASAVSHPELVEGSVPSAFARPRGTDPSTPLRSAQDDGILEEEPSQVSQLVFGLPGNALSHFVCFHLFVRRALDALMGRPESSPVHAFLSEAVQDPFNTRETWWPAELSLKEGRAECRALPWKSSGDITRLPAGNALIQVPASTSQLAAGTMVTILPTRNLFSQP